MLRLDCRGGGPGPAGRRTLIRRRGGGGEQHLRRNRAQISCIIALVTIVLFIASIVVDDNKMENYYFTGTTAMATDDNNTLVLLLRSSSLSLSAGAVPPAPPSKRPERPTPQETTTSSSSSSSTISEHEDEQARRLVAAANNSTTSPVLEVPKASVSTSTNTAGSNNAVMVGENSNNEKKKMMMMKKKKERKEQQSEHQAQQQQQQQQENQTQKLHTCYNGTHTVTMPRNAPSFVIIGAQKGGSTALQEILTGHMNVVRPKGVFGEVHYFNRYSLPPNDLSDEHICSYRYKYLQKAYDLPKLMDAVTKSDKPVLSMEKTPLYICVPGVASTVHKVFGGSNNEIKIVAILRNPIQRVYSQYLMTIRHRAAISQTTTFDMYVQSLLDRLKKANLSHAPDLISPSKADAKATTAARIAMEDNKDNKELLFVPVSTSYEDRIRLVQQHPGSIYKHKKNGLYLGWYAQHLSEWLQYFDLNKNIKIIQYEKLLANREQVFHDLADFLGIDNNDDLSETGSDKGTTKATILERKYFHRQSNIPFHQQLSNDTEAYLHQFFQPYNDELANLLGDEWRGIWD